MSRHHRALAGRRWQVLRRQILGRDNWRCQKCGRYAREVDHVIPMEDGGALWDPANLRVLCRGDHIKITAEQNRARRPIPEAVRKWRQLVDEME